MDNTLNFDRSCGAYASGLRRMQRVTREMRCGWCVRVGLISSTNSLLFLLSRSHGTKRIRHSHTQVPYVQAVWPMRPRDIVWGYCLRDVRHNVSIHSWYYTNQDIVRSWCHDRYRFMMILWITNSRMPCGVDCAHELVLIENQSNANIIREFMVTPLQRCNRF